jgi:hypothetical protein
MSEPYMMYETINNVLLLGRIMFMEGYKDSNSEKGGTF